jgi:hypothetical protein
MWLRAESRLHVASAVELWLHIASAVELWLMGPRAFRQPPCLAFTACGGRWGDWTARPLRPATQSKANSHLHAELVVRRVASCGCHPRS